jgi:hypothetical protein
MRKCPYKCSSTCREKIKQLNDVNAYIINNFKKFPFKRIISEKGKNNCIINNMSIVL